VTGVAARDLDMPHGADFWLTWQAWLLSNTLTGLTLLPMILIAVGPVGTWFGRMDKTRLIEAAQLDLPAVLSVEVQVLP
jgi:integral membrane sensor domain MASE1